MPEFCYSFDELRLLPVGWFWSLLLSQLLNYINICIKYIENNSCLPCVFVPPLLWGCSHRLCNSEEDEEDSKENCFTKVSIRVIVKLWETSLCLCQSLPHCSWDGCSLLEPCPVLYPLEQSPPYLVLEQWLFFLLYSPGISHKNESTISYLIIL